MKQSRIVSRKEGLRARKVRAGRPPQRLSGGWSGDAKLMLGTFLSYFSRNQPVCFHATAPLGDKSIFGSRDSSLHSASLARRLKIDDLDAQLAPLDRYGLTGLASVIADGIRTLAGGWRDTRCCAVSCGVRSSISVIAIAGLCTLRPAITELGGIARAPTVWPNAAKRNFGGAASTKYRFGQSSS